mmetsp:Transcript_106911/g.190029  ORF Transcript_106911/g.190029 Transcript_106911/m.190029 type:complete len:429 (-) Transcript_106911:125-1411(-)
MHVYNFHTGQSAKAPSAQPAYVANVNFQDGSYLEYGGVGERSASGADGSQESEQSAATIPFPPGLHRGSASSSGRGSMSSLRSSLFSAATTSTATGSRSSRFSISSWGYSGDLTMTEEECIKQAKISARKGQVSAFDQLLPRARHFSTDTQVLISNYFIHACSQVADVNLASTHVQKMEAYGLKPDLMTYNTLLNTFAASGDSEGAKRCIEDMKRRHIQPNVVSFSTLCKALAREGKSGEINIVIECLENHGYEANEYFFASLVSGLGAQQPPNYKAAELVLPELMVRGIRPSSVRKLLGKLLGEVRMARLYSVIGETGPDLCTSYESVEVRMIKAWQVRNAILQLQKQDEHETADVQNRNPGWIAEEDAVVPVDANECIFRLFAPAEDETAPTFAAPQQPALQAWRDAVHRTRNQDTATPNGLVIHL